MITFLNIILLLCFLGLIALFLMWRRNDAVCEFRIFIVWHYYKYYEELPKYEQMLFSFRPLTIKEYLPDLYKMIEEKRNEMPTDNKWKQYPLTPSEAHKTP